MSSIISIAGSSILTQERRIGGIASNLANIATSAPYAPVAVQAKSIADGGVMAISRPVDPSFVLQASLDGSGLEAAPNVDPAMQMSSLIEAKAVYSFAISMLREGDKMERSALSIIR
jgi:flagellar basal body rod protein FlgC